MKPHYKLVSIYAALSLIIFLLVNFTGNSANAKQNDPEVTLKEYNKRIVNGKEIILVYFSADWCTVCVKMKPIIEQIEQEYSHKIDVLRIDTERDKEVTKDFEIDALPILMIYKNGIITWTYTGLIEKSKLKAQLEAY